MTAAWKESTEFKNPAWWHRRTLMERYCTMLAAAAIVLCGVLTIALSVLYVQDMQNAERAVCLIKGCVTAANDVLQTIDLNVDPCDNFYEFACGNFLKETTIPDDKTSVTLFSKTEDKLAHQLRSIVEEAPQPGEARPNTMAKTLYKACMDKDSIEEIGLSHMKELVSLMGGWPVLEGDVWDEGKFTWEDTIHKFNKYGFSPDYMFVTSITPDLKNSSRRIIDIDQAKLSLSREYLVKGLDEKLVAALYDYMVDIACIFGADRKRAEKELKESLQFEIKLAKISLPPELRRDPNKLYNPMTVSELQDKFPTILWIEYFDKLMPKEVDGIHLDDIVIVDVPEFIKNLEVQLSRTQKRVQANYLLWRAVESAVSSLNEEVRNRQLNYISILSGRSEHVPRWKECTRVSAGGFALAVGSLYVKKFFKQDVRKDALEMVNNLRDQMYKTLEKVDWMDDKTRKNALEKATDMTSHIAYPDEILDTDKLDQFYKKLELNKDIRSNKTNYMEMVLNMTKFGKDFLFGLLREPVNKTDWRTHGRPAIINAFYRSVENSIQLPAGILQGAFFSYDRPNYLNYGAIGYVIGHEITHGFDDQGRQFNKEGNLVDWWEPETKEAYLKKAQCIIHQYGNYTSEQVGMKLNGVNTQGENIADNGGMKQAYYAYNSWVRQHGEEKRLPGLERFTPQQMFWISAANTWCSKYRSEALKLMIVIDHHSPDEFRVRGPLSNQVEFANDFKCPLGSQMNPAKKCQVW